MELLIIVFLVLLNGFFSMSEMALVSSKKVRLEAAAKAGKKGAASALALASSPNVFLSTVQIGITLIGLLTGIYSGESVTDDLESYLSKFEILQPIADGLAVSIVLVIITFLTLVLGELVPKRLGLANPEGISRFVAPFMKILSKLAYPFVWLLTHVSDALLKILNIQISKENRITEEEIKSMIRESTEEGEIQKIEQGIVEQVFQLGDRKVTSIMTPRTKVIFIDVNESHERLAARIAKYLRPAYAVYENTPDNVLGAIPVEELLLVNHRRANLRDYVDTESFLPESTPVYRALERFKASGRHYGLVVNEYGSLLGLLTMNDILQSLVSHVAVDNSDTGMQKLSDGSWLIPGQFPFSQFVTHFGINDAHDLHDIITVGGLILEIVKDIPSIGQKVSWQDLVLEVVEMDNVRIDKVRVFRKQSAG